MSRGTLQETPSRDRAAPAGPGSSPRGAHAEQRHDTQTRAARASRAAEQLSTPWRNDGRRTPRLPARRRCPSARRPADRRPPDSQCDADGGARRQASVASACSSPTTHIRDSAKTDTTKWSLSWSRALMSAGVMTTTLTSRPSSRDAAAKGAARERLETSPITNRSTSLSALSSPRANDPNTNAALMPESASASTVRSTSLRPIVLMTTLRKSSKTG